MRGAATQSGRGATGACASRAPILRPRRARFGGL